MEGRTDEQRKRGAVRESTISVDHIASNTYFGFKNDYPRAGLLDCVVRVLAVADNHGLFIDLYVI